MLNVSNLSGFNSNLKNLPSLVATNLVFRASDIPTNTYTFSSVSINTATSSRYVIVAVTLTRESSAPNQPTSVTVDGKSTRSLGNYNMTYSGLFANVSLWITNTPISSGDTADIVVTGPASSYYRMTAVPIILYDIDNSTPVQTYVDTSSPYSGTLNIPSSGIAIGLFVVVSTGTSNWTGMIEISDVEGFSFAYAISEKGNSAFPFSASPSSTTIPPGLISASFK